MALSKARQLVKRYEKLRDARRNFDNVWQELASFIVPRRSNITVVRAPGTKQTEKLFDSTAIKANYDLAAFIAATLTSPVVRWFSLRMRDSVLNEDMEVRKWLDDCANILYARIQQSNFNSEVLESYVDLGAFGTAALLIEEAPRTGTEFNGYLFRAEPIGTYAIAENAYGRVDTLFNLFPLSVRAAADRWGEDKLSDKAKAKLEKNPDESIEILHAVYPRGTNGITRTKLPWASCYVEKSSETEASMLEEGGFHEFPYVVPRWSKTSGEEYGRGPGHIALPDIKTLNEADKLTLKAWQKAIDPPMMVLNDGVIGRISFVPSALNVVTNPDALKPLNSEYRVDIDLGLRESKRASVRAIFFADQLQLPDKTIITATEVERRIELMQQVLGPTLGRLEYEFLTPLIDRLFAIALRNKQLPKPPAALLNAPGAGPIDLDIEYEGPLARAQRSGDLNAIQRFYQSQAPIIQLTGDPSVLDVYDADEGARHTAQIVGLPARLIRDSKKVAEIRTQRAEMQAEQLQRAKEQQMAETVNTMADAEQKMTKAGATSGASVA